MRGRARRAAACLLALCLAVSGTGCGKGGQTGQDAEGLSATGLRGTDAGPKWQYGAEKLNVGTDEDISYCVKLLGEELYYSLTEWNEETESWDAHIRKYSPADGSVTELPLKIEKGYPLEMDICEDGSVYAVMVRSEAGREESFRRLEKYGPDGSMSYCTEIEEWVSGSWNLRLVTDEEGRGYLTREGDARIFLFDAEGEFAGTIDTVNDGGNGAGRVNAICRGKDGKIYACVTGRNTSLVEADFARREAKVILDEFADCTEGSLGVSEGKDLLANDGSMVYEYDLAEKTRETLFAWTDSGVKGRKITALGALPNEKFLAVQKADSGEAGGVFLLSRLSDDEKPQKEELVLMGIVVGQALEEAVVDFNKSSDKYHITIRDYTDEEWGGNTHEDVSARMGIELISDNAPDLVSLSSIYPGDIGNLVKQGVLEDLAPWLDKSSVISREDFVDGTLEACTYNGVLTELPKWFTIQTVMGNASIVGDEEGISLERLMSLAEEHPKSGIFNNTDKSNILTTCLKYSMDVFVDRDAGTCSFDSPEFIRLLETADRAGAVKTDSDATEEELYQRGEILFYTYTLEEFTRIQKINDVFGGNACNIGFPTADGTLTNEMKMLRFGGCSMTANSKHKEGAWAFLEFYAMAEVMKELKKYPTLKARIEESMKGQRWDDYLEERKDELNGEDSEFVKYEKDSDGKVVRDEKGKPVVREIILYYDNMDNMFAYHAIRDEEVEQVMDIIRTARPVPYADWKLLTIVEEEADYFFNGSKSAADVADIIQSRARLYLSENQ